MNSVMLRGRIVDTPVMKIAANGTAIATATLAVPDYTYKTTDGYNTSFVNIVGFGAVGNLMNKYLTTKGQEIIVQGKLVTGSYAKEDGSKGYYSEVAIDHLEFVGKKNDLEEKASKSKK